QVDTLSSVGATRIAFSRQMSDRTATMVFDTVAQTFTEIDPRPGSLRLQTAIGGSRVAFVDAIGSGPSDPDASVDIAVHDLDSNQTTNVSRGISGLFTGNPHIAPDGNSVVWEGCTVTVTQCDVYAAYWVAGSWQPVK